MKLRSLVLLIVLSSSLGACASLKFWDKTPQEEMAELKPITASAKIDLGWRVKVGKGEDAIVQPAAIGESVLAAGVDGNLYRIEAGKTLWRARTPDGLTVGVGAGNGLAVVASHAQVFAFEADTGVLRWKADVHGEVSAPPLVDTDQVFVRVGDSQILSLGSADGRRRWSYQRSTPPLSLRTFNEMLRVENYLFSGFPGGRLAAVAANNGQLAWEGSVALPRGSTELERLSDVVGVPVALGKFLCAGAYQGRVTCFDVTRGTAVWGRDVSTTVGIDGDSSRVFVTDDRGAVQAFDLETGGTIWKQDALKLRGVGRPLVLDRFVAVGDVEGWVHLLNKADGHFAARFRTDGSPILSPMLRTEDGLVVQTRDGGVFSLKLH